MFSPLEVRGAKHRQGDDSGKARARGEHDAGEDLRFGRLPQGVAIRGRRLEQIA